VKVVKVISAKRVFVDKKKVTVYPWTGKSELYLWPRTTPNTGEFGLHTDVDGTVTEGCEHHDETFTECIVEQLGGQHYDFVRPIAEAEVARAADEITTLRRILHFLDERRGLRVHVGTVSWRNESIATKSW
jgi:hypothetical protein